MSQQHCLMCIYWYCIYDHVGLFCRRTKRRVSVLYASMNIELETIMFSDAPKSWFSDVSCVDSDSESRARVNTSSNIPNIVRIFWAKVFQKRQSTGVFSYVCNRSAISIQPEAAQLPDLRLCFSSWLLWCLLCISRVILTHADDDCNSSRMRNRWVGKACLSWEGQSIPVSLTNELYFRPPLASVLLWCL